MADGDIKKMQVVVEAKTDGVKQQLDTVSRGVNDVKKAIQSATGVSFGDLENSLKATYTEAKKVTNELAKTFSPAQITQGIQQAKSQMRSAEKEMRKYADKGGQMFKNASFDYQDAKGRLEGLTTELHKVKNVANSIEIKGLKDERPMANVKAINSQWLKNLKENGWYSPDVDTIKNTYQGVPLNNYKPTANIDDYVGNKAYESPELDIVITKIDTIKAKLSSIKGAIRYAFSTDGLEVFSEKMSNLSNALDNALAKMKSLGLKVANVGRRFLSALNPLKMFRNEQNKTSQSSNILSKAFSRLARMFRIMVTRMLIRGFISNIREGFQNIAQYSDEVNQKFSSIIASAKTLYNATASAFTPIIEALTPIITKALDTMTYAMNKVAEFMSALTGKSYFIKATKYQYNYAKSLDKTSKSASKTAKKVKELKSATIGIDKLNVIEPNKPTNSGVGSGNGNGNNGANVNDMFETKPVSKKMKDLAKEVRKIAKKLFDPIQKAWNIKGKYVINAWKKALKSIWKTTKAIGKDFLKVWGQKKTQKIFENIFDILKDGGKVVKNLSDNFRKAWKHNNIGKRILENIRNIIFEISDGFKRMADRTVKWSKKINFEPLLNSLERLTKACEIFARFGMQVLGDFYSEFLLPLADWTIGEGLPKFLDIFSSIGKKIHWSEISRNLKELWSALEPFVEGLATGFLDFLKDFSNVPVGIINELFGDEGAIKGMTDTLNGISTEQAEQWGYNLGVLVTSILGFKAVASVTKTLTKVTEKVKSLAGALEWLAQSNPIGFEMGVVYGADQIDKVLKSISPRLYEFVYGVVFIFNYLVSMLGEIFEGLASTMYNIIITPLKMISDQLVPILRQIAGATGNVELLEFVNALSTSAEYVEVKSPKDMHISASKNAFKYAISYATGGQVSADDVSDKAYKKLTNNGKNYPDEDAVKKYYGIDDGSSKKKKKKKKKKKFAYGGFPKLGSEFIAGEKGAEFVGNINGKTGVASNQEITGIRDSIESSSSAQNQILIEQNNLLRALLEKNTDIVLDGEKVTKKVNKINARSGYRMAT